jgi:hypothetical protein
MPRLSYIQIVQVNTLKIIEVKTEKIIAKKGLEIKDMVSRIDGVPKEWIFWVKCKGDVD